MAWLDVCLPAVSVVAVFSARIFELGTKRDTVPGTVREKLTLRLFIVAGVIMLVSVLVELVVSQRRIFWLAFVIGWFMALASFGIRRRAIAALGQFWSLHVEIRDNHQFVRTGPFRWLRHPTYFSMILELASVAVIAASFWSLLIIPVIFFPILLFRLRIEEGALVEKFGAKYVDYQRTTPAIFPYRIPAKPSL